VDVSIFLYDGVSAVEALGPHEVLRRIPDVTFRFVAENPGPLHAHSPALILEAQHSLAQAPETDVLILPGGFGCRQLVHHRRVLRWLGAIDATTEWTLAVSTGSVVLAAAGLLTGLEATTHWLARDLLAHYGAKAVMDSVVEDGKKLTARGPAGAIEASLRLAARYSCDERAREIQAELEFDAEDPFDPDASHPVAQTVMGWHQGMHDRARVPRPRWWRRSRRIIINPAA
jgi:putative intracellular protease/amidase